MSSADDRSRTVFVFESRLKPYRFVVVYDDDAKLYVNNPKRWAHTATLNPAPWIEYLLNHPEERTEQIEGLFKMKTYKRDKC